MEYLMKAGVLYSGEKPAAYLKGDFCGPEKRIFQEDGKELFRAWIQYRKKEGKSAGDIRNKQYILTDAEGHRIASAAPGYAEGEDPDTLGWPVYRLPQADHADLTLEKTSYRMIMENSQNYVVTELSGKEVIRILHNGIAGGWRFRAASCFTPALLCGIFVFCRYLEQENDFSVV